LEDVYNFEDALLVGGMLITLMRNSDRVKIACLAQLVNVIAPIMTSERGCWAQTTFWPFLHASQYGRGTSLQPIIDSPVYSSADYDDVPFVDASAILADDGSLTIFAVNRSNNNDVQLYCDLRSFGALHFKEQIILHHDDIKATNTETAPDTVVPTLRRDCDLENGKVSVVLPGMSWNVLKFSQTN
jgi:alpha-N-arabinofuranosidase